MKWEYKILTTYPVLEDCVHHFGRFVNEHPFQFIINCLAFIAFLASGSRKK